MVFNLRVTPIIELSNIIQLPSRVDARKPGSVVAKINIVELGLISVPADHVIPKYKYPVRLFRIQAQE